MDDIEAIKQLKARYFRTLDTKDWMAFREVFADDVVSDTTDSGGTVITGAEEFVAYVRENLGDRPTVHQGHMPEIELISETAATGIWAMYDLVRVSGGIDLAGYGHYHETYEKVDGRWRIRTSTLIRLRVDICTPVVSVRVSERLKRALAMVAAWRSA